MGQRSQLNGRSPSCVLLCRSRLPWRGNVLWQISQLKLLEPPLLDDEEEGADTWGLLLDPMILPEVEGMVDKPTEAAVNEEYIP